MTVCARALPKFSRLASVALLFCAFSAPVLAQPKLQIISPKSGTLFHPGDTVTVEASASGEIFQLLSISCVFLKPLAISGALNQPPYRFSVRIASDTEPGRYSVYALGVIRPGEGVASERIAIDVEPADSPVSLVAEPSELLDLDIWLSRFLNVRGSNLEINIPTQYLKFAHLAPNGPDSIPDNGLAGINHTEFEMSAAQCVDPNPVNPGTWDCAEDSIANVESVTFDALAPAIHDPNIGAMTMKRIIAGLQQYQ